MVVSNPLDGAGERCNGQQMSTAWRATTAAAATLAAIAVFGFVIFATRVTRSGELGEIRADGIVVLTGGELRIAEGARLLSTGSGQRMLISGVNPRTSREDIIGISHLDRARFDCCVDLGYRALDTVGNAAETRAWAERHRFSSLIVVTSSYHMPRGLAELSMEMPGVRLVPRPVTPTSLRTRAWWLHFGTTRVLLAEYVKFLGTAARLTVARFGRPIEGGTPLPGILASRSGGI